MIIGVPRNGIRWALRSSMLGCVALLAGIWPPFSIMTPRLLRARHRARAAGTPRPGRVAVVRRTLLIPGIFGAAGDGTSPGGNDPGTGTSVVIRTSATAVLRSGQGPARGGRERRAARRPRAARLARVRAARARRTRRRRPR